MDAPPTVFVGVDVQTRRGCACVALDRDGAWLDGRWTAPLPRAAGVRAHGREAIAGDIVDFCRTLAGAATVMVGIDAPRAPLRARRRWYWDRTRREWRPRAPGEKGLGRHADVVVASAEGVRIQWTPLARGRQPAWMELGFAIFRGLEAAFGPRRLVHEVFPSASYAQFAREPAVLARLGLRDFRRGPKDMLDAAVAALTVYEFAAGRGCEVGGCDGQGTIVLPRPLPAATPETLRRGWARL